MISPEFKVIVRRPRPKKSMKQNIVRYPKKAGWTPPRYLAIIKKTPTKEELQKWIATTSGFVGGLTKDMEGNPSEFYDYQTQHMENYSLFRHVDKSRQVGISYAFSAESLSKCHLKKLQTSIFISYNQEEASEKIRFARALHESLPLKFQKRLAIDNRQSLEFEHNGHKTRILSFAQRQPRGKGMNTDVYLDEFAHMIWARLIYVAALPVISRGTGVLTLASTPFGKDNLHYEISADTEKYSSFSRMRIFWWDCPELCINVRKARKRAPYMTTEERVARFATTKMKAIFSSYDIDDFKQEYELYYADESISYFPLDLIQRCVYDFEDNEERTLNKNIDPEEAPVAWDKSLITQEDDDIGSNIMEHHAEHNISWYCLSKRISSIVNSFDPVGGVNDVIDKLLIKMNEKKFGRNLLAGVDIGRKKDSTEISIFEQIEINNYNLHVERLSIELSNIMFRNQKEILRLIINRLPIRKMRIDSTGIGIDIAETLEGEYPGIVEGVHFDNENKAEMTKKLKFRFEDRTVAIYNDTESIKHIHSIKKTHTETYVKYGTHKSKKGHHGDKFWAKALASSAGDDYDRSQVISDIVRTSISNARIFGPDGRFVRSPDKNALVIPVVAGASELSRFGINRTENGVSYDNPIWSMFADKEFRGI